MCVNILIVDPIHQSALMELSAKYNVVCKIHPGRKEFIKLLRDAEILVIRSGMTLDKKIIDESKNLKMIVRAGSGLDNIPVKYCKANNIKVLNIPNTSHSSVAEFTFGLILCLIRKINIADSQLRENTWKKPELYGYSLYGKTIGIIGIGKIGSYVANIAKGFNLKVLATAEKIDNQRKVLFKKQGIELVALDNLLEFSDIVSLHVPLKKNTKYLINIDKLKLMKESSFLINLSRGKVVKEQDVVFVLKNNIIAGYATDVFEKEKEKSELFNLHNTVFTPHIGAMTYEAQEEIGKILVQHISDFVRN